MNWYDGERIVVIISKHEITQNNDDKSWTLDAAKSPVYEYKRILK